MLRRTQHERAWSSAALPVRPEPVEGGNGADTTHSSKGDMAVGCALRTKQGGAQAAPYENAAGSRGLFQRPLLLPYAASLEASCI